MKTIDYIFNRTALDVENSKNIISTQLPNESGVVVFDEAQIETLEKGTFSLNCLNRITEGTIEQIKEIKSMGYFDLLDYSGETKWEYGDDYFAKDFSALVNCISYIRNAFFREPGTAQLNIYNASYTNINNIERALNYSQNKIFEIKKKYRFCGDAYCGME